MAVTSIKNNPYYLNWVNKVGLPYADALMAQIFGTDQQKKDAEQFIKWIDKQANTKHKGGNRK